MFVNKQLFDGSLPDTIQPLVRFTLPEEPIMHLEILKSHVSLASIPTNFLVTPRGMIGSLRKNTKGDITIGRQQIIEKGCRPNDIMLNPTDPSVSRSHCAISYDKGLYRKRKVPKEFSSFLMVTHLRIGKYAFGNNLPLVLLMHIYDFIKEKSPVDQSLVGS